MSAPTLVAAPANDLDRLVGLCDEISALVKMGLPLEESLLQMSQSKRENIAAQIKKLAEELGTGKSLAEAVKNDPAFPPVFTAVVQAGIESGNLSAALDSIADSVRTLRDTRLFLLRSSLYPLVLFTALWLVFVFVLFFSTSRVIPFFESYTSFFAYDWMTYLFSDAVRGTLFTVCPPLALWIAFFVWSFSSSRNHVIQSGGGHSLAFRLVPWAGQAAVELQKSSFAQILATLLRSSMPLDQSILLAAQTCNDQYWGQAPLEALQNHIIHRQNNTESQKPYPKSVLSPLIDWTLGIPNQAMLLEGVQYYSKISRTRAELLLAKCEMFIPPCLTLGIAVLLGLCYVTAMIIPFMQLVQTLAEPLPL